MTSRVLRFAEPRVARWWPVLPLLAVVPLARLVVGAPGSRLALLGLALVLVAIGLATLGNWRLGLFMFIGWLILEDLPRKYLGNNMVIYFGKDVLIALSYIAFALALRAGKVQVVRPAFFVPLVLFSGLGVVQVFNPGSPSLLYGALGVKLYFFYVPLFFMGYVLPRSSRDVGLLLMTSTAIAFVVAALGIAQGIIGLDFLNPASLAPELQSLGHEIRYSPSGAVVPRATSIFVSEGRQGSFMLLSYILSIGAAGLLAAQRRGGAKFAMLAAAVTLAAVLLHGSRAGVLYALLTTLVVSAVLLWFWRAPSARQPLRTTLIGVGAGAVVIVALLAFFFPNNVFARWALYSETISPWSPTSELGWRLWGYPAQGLRYALNSPNALLGRGIGTASIGAQYVAEIFGVPHPPPSVESGFGTMLLELGALGPLLWIAWAVALVAGGWRAVTRLRDSALFPVGVVILWFAVLLLFPMTYGALNAYQNFVYNAYFWLLTGLLYRLPSLVERQPAAPSPEVVHAA